MNTTATLFALILAASAITGNHVHAQYGMPDPTFNPLDDGTYGDGPVHYSTMIWDHTAIVHASAELPDGKILLAGKFHAYNDLQAWGMVRVNADGSVDPTFDVGDGASPIHAMVVLPDGRILAGGIFSSFGGHALQHVVRLEPDGAVDLTFDTGTGPNGPVYALLVQADGRIVIAGGFTQVQGVERRGIARLLPDGVLDTSFDPGAGAMGNVHALALEADGSFIMGGTFNSVDGVERRGLARLFSDGALDPLFDPGSGPPYAVRALALDGQGRMIVGGDFTQMAGGPAPRIARLLPDGSADPSFNVGAGADQTVFSLLQQSDGGILVGGMFSNINGIPRPLLARLDENGVLDQGFNARMGQYSVGVHSASVQQDGRILIGGDIHVLDSHMRIAVARLHENGSVDISFNPTRGPSGLVDDMAMLPDGRIVIAGRFATYNDEPRPNLALLTSNGLLDMSFQPGAWLDSTTVRSVHVISGERLLVSAGPMVPQNFLHCLRFDGSPCTDFDNGTGPNGTVYAVAELPDGRILIGGSFMSYDGQPIDRIARLLPDGSLDPTFIGPGSIVGSIHAMALRPDGRILITGNFTELGGIPRNRVAGLLSDGTVDLSFEPGTGPNSGGANGPFDAMALRPDGKLLLGGGFTFVNGIARRGLVLLDTLGGVSTDFVPDFSPSFFSEVHALALLPDGRIVIAGLFSAYGGQERICMARLMPDASLDITFDPGEGPWSWFSQRLHHVIADAQDNYLVAGVHIRFDGVPRHRLARILGGGGVWIAETGHARRLHAWPNPVQDLLHFEQPVAGRVFDAQGRAVLEVSMSSTQNVQALSPGLYILRTLEGSALRFVKE
jgi:uncharacterized delta-60 repeat protein